MTQESPPRRGARAPVPLDAAALDTLALGYAARFATTGGKLAAYLRRKLRERGWAGEREPDIAGVVARLVAAGYVDDAAFASARTAGLLRRGYGARRIDQTLRAAGVEAGLRAATSGTAQAGRQAALAFARRRRFGPYGAAADPAQRRKQLAAMLRAGHPLASARAMVNAASVEAAEMWAAEEDDDER